METIAENKMLENSNEFAKKVKDATYRQTNEGVDRGSFVFEPLEKTVKEVSIKLFDICERESTKLFILSNPRNYLNIFPRDRIQQAVGHIQCWISQNSFNFGTGEKLINYSHMPTFYENYNAIPLDKLFAGMYIGENSSVVILDDKTAIVPAQTNPNLQNEFKNTLIENGIVRNALKIIDPEGYGLITEESALNLLKDVFSLDLAAQAISINDSDKLIARAFLKTFESLIVAFSDSMQLDHNFEIIEGESEEDFLSNILLTIQARSSRFRRRNFQDWS